MHPNVHSSTIFNSLDTDANLIFIDRRIDRIWIDMKKLLSYKKIEYGVYKDAMEYYSAIKVNEILPLVEPWMDLEIIILTEERQKEKDKYHVISHIHAI